jgi:glycosyltransferase involved in cell wall biosynthesis
VTAPRIAIVHDWLDTWRGGENALAEMIAVYPDADVFALVDFLPDDFRARLRGKQARTSFLQHVPLAPRFFRWLLPLFPRAIESLDVSRYDIVISSSHAVAKGARTTPRQLHICYCYTPMRYAWDLREQYLTASRHGRGLRGAVVRQVLDRLQSWDRATSARVNRFIAISGYIRDRIRRCYGRDATVIHPPVDIEFFVPAETPPTDKTNSYYMAASRWVPYKRIDLIVEAFNALADRRLVVAGDGPDARRVRRAAGTNVEFVGEVSRERLRDLLRGARAFLFAADEDFGILPVEAAACGTPVIALGRGGVLETVRGIGTPGPTGVFFSEQSASAIADAVRRFEGRADAIDPADCRANALRFSGERFRSELAQFVDGAWNEFVAVRR